jgi:hypothetical protein
LIGIREAVVSALAPRNSDRIADQQEQLESSDIVDLSPAALWGSDYEADDETTLQGEEENEKTLQGQRVDAQHIDLMSANDENGGLVETPRQLRILDESQVLPGEASFATVNLNQPFESSVLKPQDSGEPISTSSVNDCPERNSAPRVQLMDESQVLASEASFATVMLGARTKAQRYSPITEFLVKTKLSFKQLVLAVFALVSVLALAVIVLLRMTGSEVVTVKSAPPPSTVDTARQSSSTSTTESRDSGLMWNPPGEVSGSASPTQAATAEATQDVADAKRESPNSGDSRKAPLIDAKSGAVRQEILREVNPVGARVASPKEPVTETRKQSAAVDKKAVKEPAIVKTPNAAVRSEPRQTPPDSGIRQGDVPVTVENVETKTPAVTGGAERPRTVTRKPNP